MQKKYEKENVRDREDKEKGRGGEKQVKERGREKQVRERESERRERVGERVQSTLGENRSSETGKTASGLTQGRPQGDKRRSCRRQGIAFSSAAMRKLQTLFKGRISSW